MNTTVRRPMNAMTKDTPLIDGVEYDLGALWAEWSSEQGVFLTGNSYIEKGRTYYADNPVG